MSTPLLRHFLTITLAVFGLGVVVPSSWAQTCIVNIPHIDGEWRTLPYLMPINPISATLLNTGKVLIVAGSENDAKNNSHGAESYRNAIWDPTAATQSSITVQNMEYDVFCSGTAALPDGRALVVGGTSDYSFTGDNRASIFDPATERFVQSQSMVDGRWYATATTLGDGRIMAFSGLGLSGATNKTVEIYDLKNAGAGWSSPATAPFSPPLYPQMFLLPNGKVFYTGQGSGRTANAWIFDPMPKTWAQSVTTTRDRHYGSAVLLPLLPPSYTPKVMNFGGGDPATSTTEIIDLSVGTPSWMPGPNMSTGRIQMNAVILPNGTVLAQGGSVNNESPNPAGKHADLYDPVSNSFSSGGTASYSRLYHSVALLLPDASVMSMGSNPGPRGNYEPAIEIYRPAYLFDSSDHLIPAVNRPSITGIAPGVIGYNAPFSVTYTSISAISSAVLVRPGSTTHTLDMDQRLIGLCGPSPQPPCNGSAGSGTLNLTSPPNGNIAPPGYYMLFLLDSAGVPSVAQFIQLSLYSTTHPSGTIASPTSDITIAAGSMVSFTTTSTAAKYSWVFPGGTPGTSSLQNPGNVVFNTPGTYVASLTVIDSGGNSDPSPPTRTITVLPPSADFSIAVSPSSQEVIPGQSTTFTVTVSSLSGFNGLVTLSVGSENGFPSGITSGGFSPSSITGSGASTLRINTTTSATPYALSLTITGTAGTITHTASTTLLVRLASPASLTATPGTGQVSVSWPASVGATSYHVKRATVTGGPYTTIACATATNYTDTGLTGGTTYYYVVSAAYSAGPNAGGESADSSEATATPQGLAKPLAPALLSAAPGNGQVALSWSASSDATSYNVKRATVSGGPYIVIASPSSTSYIDFGLTNGTTYYYVVSAVNSAGESANSSQVSATPQPPASPLAPTNVMSSSGPPKGGVTIRWTQSATPGVIQNFIYRRTSSGSYPTAPTVKINAATSYVDTKLSSGTTYCYQVTAVSSGGESPKSSEACAKAK
jgi:fibronectin type 3 domain-containing protein